MLRRAACVRVDIEFLPGIARKFASWIVLRCRRCSMLPKRMQRHLIDQQRRCISIRARHPAERQLDLIIELFHTGCPDPAGQHFIECTPQPLPAPEAQPPRCFLPHLLRVHVADLRAAVLREHAVELIARPASRPDAYAASADVEDKAVGRESTVPADTRMSGLQSCVTFLIGRAEKS